MEWIARAFVLLLLLLTWIPFLPSGRWYIRVWDFPRLQLLFLLLAFLAIAMGMLVVEGWNPERVFWAACLTVASWWQASHVIRFTGIWPKEVEPTNPAAETRKVFVANLKFDNENQAPTLETIREVDADVLILIELDSKWESALSTLVSDYPFRHQETRSEGLGIGVWSRLPFVQVETRYLVSERRASIWSQVEWSSGQTLKLVAIHPTPPGLLDSTGESRRDSRVRDAELILIAQQIQERRDENWIVAGDFNDVAWSHTTRLFKRLSGLSDPRVGRSFLGTFPANIPPFRCPIDHVFVSKAFSIREYSRKRLPGSDHFGLYVDLSLCDRETGVEPRPQADDRLEARQILVEGKRDARNRAVLNRGGPVDQG